MFDEIRESLRQGTGILVTFLGALSMIAPDVSTALQGTVEIVQTEGGNIWTRLQEVRDILETVAVGVGGLWVGLPAKFRALLQGEQ